jgi:hypothetical protein
MVEQVSLRTRPFHMEVCLTTTKHDRTHSCDESLRPRVTPGGTGFFSVAPLPDRAILQMYTLPIH